MRKTSRPLYGNLGNCDENIHYNWILKISWIISSLNVEKYLIVFSNLEVDQQNQQDVITFGLSYSFECL